MKMVNKKYQHGFRVRLDGDKRKVMQVFKLLKKFCKENNLDLGFYSQTGKIVREKVEKEKKKKGFFS